MEAHIVIGYTGLMEGGFRSIASIACILLELILLSFPDMIRTAKLSKSWAGFRMISEKPRVIFRTGRETRWS